MLKGDNMPRYYKSGFETGVIRFAEYLKEHACFYDIDNYHSFSAIDIDDLDDLLEDFFDKCEYL